MSLDSVILCKNSNGINIIATGEYSKLSKMMPFYRKISGGNEIKLVSTSGIDIENVIKEQKLIDNTFRSHFS